jgi:hypothetical protein
MSFSYCLLLSGAEGVFPFDASVFFLNVGDFVDMRNAQKLADPCERDPMDQVENVDITVLSQSKPKCQPKICGA